VGLFKFDQKAGDVYESDSDDVDESLTVPKPPVDQEVRESFCSCLLFLLTD
jgi:hypothetical protein